MNINELTILYVILHILADYYFQSPKLAGKKDAAFGAVALHALIYALVMLSASLALALLGADWRILLAGAVISILHMLVDAVKFGLQQQFQDKLKPGSRGAGALYLVDQGVHLLVIALLFLGDGVYRAAVTPLQALPPNTLKRGLMLLVNAKPANVTFKRLFYKYMLDDSISDPVPKDTLPQKPPEPGAGALIGTFERFLSILFIHLGQFAAIGLVYTAKSIARLEKIGKNPRFAEYYLIGTLYSILFVLVSYLVIFRFM